MSIRDIIKTILILLAGVIGIIVALAIIVIVVSIIVGVTVAATTILTSIAIASGTIVGGALSIKNYFSSFYETVIEDNILY